MQPPKGSKVLVCVSGGLTSALMAFLLNTRFKEYYELRFIFNNTSRERIETLEFVEDIERYFHIYITWLESVVNEGRRSCTHTVVNPSTAKKNGEVFEQIIRKYGIPNKNFSHCTRELKMNPAKSFCRSIGWKDYYTAIGYRKDEPKRVNTIFAQENKQWYPLWDWQITKIDVLAFWERQRFKLHLKDFEGNCRLCFKKSKRKILLQMTTDPDSILWISQMEKTYRYYQKQGRQKISDKGILFFRGNTSIDELKQEIIETDFLSENYDIELDEQESCADSCEAF